MSVVSGFVAQDHFSSSVKDGKVHVSYSVVLITISVLMLKTTSGHIFKKYIYMLHF